MNNLFEAWDNKTLDYDLEAFNWPKWALERIQEIAPEVQQLETLHQALTPEKLVRVQQHVQNACSRRDFMEKFDHFVEIYAKPRISGKRYMIQRQGTLRVVIPEQAKVGRRLQFHQGVFVGNGRGLRTIWTPLTEAKKTNTMWIVDLDRSRQITKNVLAGKWTLEKFEDECLKYAWPVTLTPGQSHLFFQEHLHGNVNNEEGYTRVAIDMRVLIEGEEYGRKLPGGFFRLPGDYEVSATMDYTGSKFITYAGWNSNFSKWIPLPMQRAIIETYCNKNKISYSDYQFENEYMDWLPGLEHFIRQKPDGIVLSSIFSLCDDQGRRNELLNLSLDLGVELHFANELCSLRTASDLDRINTYLNFALAQKGSQSWE